jgi:hypothetical protein
VNQELRLVRCRRAGRPPRHIRERELQLFQLAEKRPDSGIHARVMNPVVGFAPAALVWALQPVRRGPPPSARQRRRGIGIRRRGGPSWIGVSDEDSVTLSPSAVMHATSGPMLPSKPSVNAYEPAGVPCGTIKARV